MKINCYLGKFDFSIKKQTNSKSSIFEIRINPYMGSNSDHMGFLQRAGIPCIDNKFINNRVC